MVGTRDGVRTEIVEPRARPVLHLNVILTHGEPYTSFLARALADTSRSVFTGSSELLTATRGPVVDVEDLPHACVVSLRIGFGPES